MPDLRVVHYRCTNCDYAFMRAENFPISKTCPYCSQPTVKKIEDKGKDLIREI